MSFESDFELLPLGEVVIFINGDRSTNYPKGDDYVSNGIPFISAADLSDGRIQHGCVKRISYSAYDRLRSGKIQHKDILFCLRGSIGKLAFVQQKEIGAIASSLVIVRATEKIDARYLYFILCSQTGQQAAASLNNGSAQPNLSVGELQKVRIPLPSISIQRQISATLDSFDDRITLLRETNATLEAIAQALFKSWFVDFDPVRAKMDGRTPEGMDEATAALFPDGFETSELGEVPRGWLPIRLDSFLEFAYGKALKAENRNPGPVPVYGSGGITGWHDTSLIDGPSIIVGRKGTVGSLYWESRPFYPIDTVFYVKAKHPLTYCHQLLKTLGLHDMNTDAAVPGLNRENAYRLQVPDVPKEVLTAFDMSVQALRQSIDHNEAQAQTLSTLRDTLLPRLISGQLRLPEAQAATEAAIGGALHE